MFLDKAVESCEDEAALNARSRCRPRIENLNIFSRFLRRCYFKFGEYSKSIKDAEEALDMNPFSLSARHNLGQALYASGQFENALKNFYRACRSPS